MVGYYGFHVGLQCVHPSVVHPSNCPYFCFWTITLVNVNGFSSNLIYALILRRSGLGLLMGKFRQILTELPARDMPVFSFPDHSLSKGWWIFTKLAGYYACGAFISLVAHQVLLSEWYQKNSRRSLRSIRDPEQTGGMHSLVWVFAVCVVDGVGFPTLCHINYFIFVNFEKLIFWLFNCRGNLFKNRISMLPGNLYLFT